MPPRFQGMILTWQAGAGAVAHADAHRRGHLDLSGAARGAAAAGRGAAASNHDVPFDVIAEIAREAVVGLVRNRMRAGLSMLGISWGIVSVVMLLAYGEGFNQALLRGFHGAFGDGVSIMFPGQTSMQAGGERAGRRVRLRLADAEAVGELPLVKAWSPEFMQRRRRCRGGRSRPAISRARRRARLRRHAERSRRRPAASSTPRTCGCSAASCSSAARWRGSCSATCPPVGETVRIKGMAFDVIGVQREKVQLSNYGRPDKESVFIPYTTAGQLWNTEYLNVLVYQAMDPTLDARATDAGEGGAGQAAALQSRRRARAAHVRLGRIAEDHRPASCSA